MGAGIALAVIYFGGLKGVKNPAMFLDTHAIILVVGGTLAATLLAFPVSHLSQLLDFIFFSVFSKKHTNHLKLVEEMAAVNIQIHTPEAMNLKQKIYSHIFLREGVNLLLDNKFNHDDLSDILDDRVTIFKKKYQQDAKILNAIAKYPPAFGLLGATTGMIAMMTNLGGAGGTAAIGHAMAVALVATFWGIAAANFVLLPLSDNAQKAYLADEFTRNFIKEGVLLIKRGTEQKVLVERLSSMLPLEERFAAQTANISPLNIVQLFSRKPKKAAPAPTPVKATGLTNAGVPLASVEAGSPEISFKDLSVKKKTGS